MTTHHARRWPHAARHVLATCVALTAPLTGCTSACAQEAPPADPPPDSTYVSVFRADDLVPADVALDNLQAELDGTGEMNLFPTLSIQVNGDSTRDFARTLALTRRLAEEGPDGGGLFTSDMLRALRAMGARRPFFRALVADAPQHPNLAAAAIRLLAEDDPRPEEFAEIMALVRSLAPPGELTSVSRRWS